MVEGWESGAAGKLGQVGKAAGGRRAGSWASTLSRATSVGGAFGAAALLPPRLLRVLALLGCNSGGDPERRPGVGCGGGGDRRRKGWDRSAETGPRWRLSRGRAGKPGKGRVREARRVGTRGRLRV